MPLLLKPEDFDPIRQNETLISLIQSSLEAQPVLSKHAVPPDFHVFTESKGYKLHVGREIAGDTPYGDCVISVSCIKNWGIEAADVVRDRNRSLNHGMNINVIRDFEGLAEVDYFDHRGVNRQLWVLKADLELVHKHNGGFKKPGEA